MNATVLRVGFMPLLDCAVLVAAGRLGFAEQEGLDLRLVRESSWANIRDRMVVRQFAAAQMLGPMTVAASLGIGHLKMPMVAPIALGRGGNAVTVSLSLWGAMRRHGAATGEGAKVLGASLRAAIAERSARGEAPLSLAVVYPFSCHNFELRYWLAASGIDPDRDVQIVVLPPPLLVDALRSSQIDGFCVGEPWNSLAATAGVGCIAMAVSSIWPLAPEKVLGVRADWAASNPEPVAALVRALQRAAIWCDEPTNHRELAAVLAQGDVIGAPAELLERGLAGQLPMPETAAQRDAQFLVFARERSTYPHPQHAEWFFSQMLRWQQTVDSAGALGTARATYRPDLFRSALAAPEFSAAMPSNAQTHGASAANRLGLFDEA